jgi:hypothetical protein
MDSVRAKGAQCQQDSWCVSAVACLSGRAVFRGGHSERDCEPRYDAAKPLSDDGPMFSTVAKQVDALQRAITQSRVLALREEAFLGKALPMSAKVSSKAFCEAVYSGRGPYHQFVSPPDLWQKSP